MSTTLITVDQPELELPRELLRATGGFAWWYVDWWDEDGNGLVVIWSFGLPFLPGYADGARRGTAPAAGERPSLAVSIYRDGKPAFYLLQEYPAEQASWADDGTVTLGGSRLRTWLAHGRRRVAMELDCPVPGSEQRLRGTFHAEGPGIDHRTQRQRAPAEHLWTPLLVGAPATAELRVDDDVMLSGEGRVYHDRNGCPTPMTSLGIDRWLWGRAALPDSDLVWYLVWGKEQAPVAMAFTVDDEGGMTELSDVSVDEEVVRRAVFGLSYPERLTLRSSGEVVAHVHHSAVVDDGPFYLRMHTTVTDARGVCGFGSGEYLVPDNIDIGWQRPLVSMAVHHIARPNSMWLPLFAGRVEDRWHRLFRVGRLRGLLWPVARPEISTEVVGG